ncbi:hypothetical protein BHU72_01290 [Desulfuribacillus stibiiarsenatis]|uniref:Spore coat protein n=1 Tax=Desulfuribacillus stibiiarsenatis TaxID=1390249 RepID=A0A1E5LA37_9FIRM|nr:hypothetical protein [Desulfuribacillus stibiiarsenatis]OEH86924.1 hypothetical protein BHU72_01290 [Desulfuribacillus stibiiarsenatis]
MSNMSPMKQMTLSEKDLMYINDELNTELLMVKRYHEAAQQVTDQELQHAFRQACDMHQRHYQTILSHLQGMSQGQMQ